MLPIPGCEVGPGGEKFSLAVRNQKRSHTILLSNESEHAEWMAALLLSANARIPGLN